MNDAETTRVLNAFQRDARAALERLRVVLRSQGLYTDGVLEGWGDVRAGRGVASTVVLITPKGVRPTERTKQLGRLKLEHDDAGGWTATICMVGQPDEQIGWPPATEDEWWSALVERFRAQIVEYRAAKRAPDAAASK